MNTQRIGVKTIATGPTRLSSTIPERLIQSTGNLYWSSNPGEFQDTPSAIFRASKSSQPGEEAQLYGETGQTDFEALTFAKVDGEFYGYFVANYSNVSQIKRIPLGSVTPAGQATVWANSPAPIGVGDLVTDGSFLCWADREGIRSMPIAGGQVKTLAPGNGFEHLSVLGGTLYYTDGKAILSVPTGGGTPSNVVGNRFSPMTALHVLEVQPPVALTERPEMPGLPIAPPDMALVWGEADGAVYGMFLGETTTYQEPTADTTVVSVYSTGTRTLWSTQYSGPEGLRYQLQMSYGGVTTTLSSEIADFFVRDVLADEVAAYWTDAYVEKYTF